MDKVSVIIPCFNYIKYLKQLLLCIDYSVDFSLEIIIVDDCSTESYDIEFFELLEKYDFVFVSNRSNLGPSYCRNLGFFLSSGKFILFVDSDDLFEFSFIGKALDVFANNPLIGAISSYVLCFGVKDYVWFPAGGDVGNFLSSNSCPVFSLLRRECFASTELFDTSFQIGYEDWELWIQVTKKGWLIYIIPEILFYYRQKRKSRVVDTFANHEKIFNQIKLKHSELF